MFKYKSRTDDQLYVAGSLSLEPFPIFLHYLGTKCNPFVFHFLVYSKAKTTMPLKEDNQPDPSFMISHTVVPVYYIIQYNDIPCIATWCPGPDLFLILH